jgi:uncharacterized protein (TIGR00369 family)
LTIDDLREISETMPFNSLLGMRIERLHKDGVTIRCAVREELLNSAGVLHGGVFASLADAAVGVAIAHHFGGRRPITTTELKINYLRPIAKGKLVARSHLVRIGKHLCVGRVDLFDPERKLAAIAVVTYMLL